MGMFGPIMRVCTNDEERVVQFEVGDDTGGERDDLRADLATCKRNFVLVSDNNGKLREKIAELEAELKMAVYCCVTEAQMSKLVADQIKQYNEEHPV